MSTTQRVNVSTPASAVSLSPLARVVRTVVQTILAFAAAEPTLIGVLHLSSGTATEIASLTAAAVLVVSTVQNVLEHFGVLPTVGGKVATPPVSR
jgi:hypothetical protein